ncbi:MAG TPA: TolC family protein [Terracidiphilus sp.]|nr:TolC family protein [Terracidiphilus sp.]
MQDEKARSPLISGDFQGVTGILAGSGTSEKMMEVKMTGNLVFKRLKTRGICAALAMAGVCTAVYGQGGNPTSATNPFYGSVTAQPVSAEPLRLSLDEAVRMGLENNLGLKEAENDELALRGEKNEALQEFLPTITVSGGTGIFQHNLAAQGFGPGTISKFGALFPNGLPPGLSEITKDDLTQGQINFSQTLFSGPVIAGWKAAGAAQRVAHFAKMTARGDVVQDVATAYLHAIADGSEVDNAAALVAADQVAFEHAHEAHEAGTVANLDELRARVQLQSQQQALIVAQNALEKDLILLKREIGVNPGQKMVLTDEAPYSELALETPEEVKKVAYQDRQDYQNLQNQIVELRAVHRAYRSQRYPTLSFSGFWGVDTVNGSGSHGNFAAIGTLSVPLFREAGLRGDEEASAAQLAAVTAQLADLRNHIDEQVRDALLDVAATGKLVDVARSNVDLATRALNDETDRVSAGVDDNLPLVDAQATLAAAQRSLVESLYQYNISKLGLARAAGVIELQYKVYLGQ